MDEPGTAGVTVADRPPVRWDPITGRRIDGLARHGGDRPAWRRLARGEIHRPEMGLDVGGFGPEGFCERPPL